MLATLRAKSTGVISKTLPVSCVSLMTIVEDLILTNKGHSYNTHTEIGKHYVVRARQQSV